MAHTYMYDYYQQKNYLHTPEFKNKLKVNKKKKISTHNHQNLLYNDSMKYVMERRKKKKLIHKIVQYYVH